MDSTTHISGVDQAFYAVALIGILIVGFFRLDELVFKRRRKEGPRRPRMVQDKDGLHVESDPDGTPWEKPQGRKDAK